MMTRSQDQAMVPTAIEVSDIEVKHRQTDDEML